MGITLFTAMLRSAILTLADTLFGGPEGGFFLALPVTMLYGLVVGGAAALLCRVALSRINRRDPHETHQPK
jgi:NhaP-type Na+/H+ or K+/H+ antiporter